MLTTTVDEVLSSLLWILFGLVMIMVTLGVIDWITDRMKRNWFNLEELAGHPTAMAIFATGIMIAVAIIIHATILPEATTVLP